MEEIILTTPRLILKSITPASIHQLFNTQSKEFIVNYMGINEEEYERYKDMHEKGMETNRLSLFFFLLVNKETNMPIGECGFHTWNRTHNRAEIFYLIRNAADKNKGFITEALPVVLNYGFEKLNLCRVEGLLASDNTPSVKLLQRYGFTKEGTLRGHYNVNGSNKDSDCYSLLKWEWSK